MTKPVRYQKGSLYKDHNAWFVRYRERLLREDGTMKWQRKAERLGTIEEFPTKAGVEPLRVAFMQKVNAAQTSAGPGLTLSMFVESYYLPWVRTERRRSTLKGYEDIWKNHLSDHVGHLRLRQFRTVDASKMLRAIAEDRELTKTTLQHIKSVLSGIFTHAKNEGAFDGENPVKDARIPSAAREPSETYAYNLVQILRILEVLPLLPKSAVATAAFAGLREGELRGLEWPDYTGGELQVNRSVWKTVVDQPKTPASRQPVPVIAALAEVLDAYRASMHDPSNGVVFHDGSGLRLDMDKLAQRVIRPAVEAIGLPWYG